MAKSYFGVYQRDPYDSEKEFFINNRNVGGYAADDDAIVLNPYSIHSPQEKEAIAKNEALRVLLRSSEIQPSFVLTPQQMQQFQSYSPNPQDIQHTIFARIITGDPSAQATESQRKHAAQVFAGIMRERYGRR
jgi:hypothetical protein